LICPYFSTLAIIPNITLQDTGEGCWVTAYLKTNKQSTKKLRSLIRRAALTEREVDD
jgi:hypothetical protein